MIRTEGADDLQRLADALKATADKDLRARVGKAIRDEAKPVGRRVLDHGSDEMPQRGGLADRLRDQGKIGVALSLRGKVAAVRLTLRNPGADLYQINRGILRHPVFARRDRDRTAWVSQPVPARAFSRAFEGEEVPARNAARKAVEQALDEIARKV